jgi:hypothetical protein
MSTPYEELQRFMISNGIPAADAEIAIRRCSIAIAKRASAGYIGGGAVAYFMAMNPAAGISYVVGGATIGAGSALYSSPACADIRTAIRYWWTAALQLDG